MFRIARSLTKCITPFHAYFTVQVRIELLEALDREGEHLGNILTRTGQAVTLIALFFGVARLVANFCIGVHATIALGVVEGRRVHWLGPDSIERFWLEFRLEKSLEFGLEITYIRKMFV